MGNFNVYKLLDQVRVVFKRGRTLKEHLVRTKMLPTECNAHVSKCYLCMLHGKGECKECMTKSVVYMMKCNLCNEEYVGESGRLMRVRTWEHYKSVINKTADTAMGKHYLENHKADNVPSHPFQPTILRNCKDYTDRKLWQSVYIKYKSPSINKQLAKSNTMKKSYSVDTWAIF